MNKDIIVNRMAGLGDVICCEPIIRMLKKNGYDNIYFQSKYCLDVFQNHPDVIITHPPTGNYDFLNLNGVYERRIFENIHIVQAYIDEAKIYSLQIDRKPIIYLTEQEIGYGRKFLKSRFKWAVMNIGHSAGPLDRGFWKFSEWIPICRWLNKHEYNIVYVGGKENIEINDDFIDLNLMGKTSIRQLFSIVNSADLFVGIDSGPLHVAQSFGKKGVAIFNPKHRAEYILCENSSIIPVHLGKNHMFNPDTIITLLEKIND